MDGAVDVDATANTSAAVPAPTWTVCPAANPVIAVTATVVEAPCVIAAVVVVVTVPLTITPPAQAKIASGEKGKLISALGCNGSPLLGVTPAPPI